MTMKFLKSGLTCVATVTMLTACGGGGGGDTSSNKVPTADAGADIAVFGTKKVTLDASNSFDDDGSIVEYTWTEGTNILGKGETLNNLSFVDGEHKVTLTVTDNAGATATDTLTVVAECMNADTMVLVEDANGTVNYVGANEESSSCYEINLSSYNGTAKYVLYANMYEGTVKNDFEDMLISIYDDSGLEVKKFSAARLDEANSNMYEEFEISADGIYYLKLQRESNLASKYGFSIQPTNDSGLVHDNKGELNDFRSMATRLTLAEVQKDVNGTLNMTRVQDSSIKGTDQHDFYEIDFDRTGIFTLYMNTYEGTKDDGFAKMTLVLEDENGAEVKRFNGGPLDHDGGHILEQFTISATGKYYFRMNVWRIDKLSYNPTRYGFSIQPSLANGLVQDAEGEFNDFKSMATPLTLSEAGTEILGRLNMTRQNVSSMKSTDVYDWYEIDFDKTGIFTLDMNTYEGTKDDGFAKMTLVLEDENGVEVKRFNGGPLDEDGGHISEEFTVSSPGKYYFRMNVWRIDKLSYNPTSYGFTIK